MNTRNALGAAAAAIMITASAAAADLAGDEITGDNAHINAELIRIADALDAAVDAKDWPLARSLFTETIDVDFTSLAGGEPATIPADALIQGWSENLTAEKTSFHLRGNHRVSFEDAANAVMLSHGYAWNRLERGANTANGGEALWEVWGTYEHSFTKTDEGWRINGMTFNATAQRGNFFVRDTPGNPS